MKSAQQIQQEGTGLYCPEGQGRVHQLLYQEARERLQVKDFDVARTMIEYGGSFVRKLGAAALVADQDNLSKIKSTWPDYWTQYDRMAKQLSEVEKQASR